MYYQDNHITVYNKDCRHMSELPDESVQCVVTSPPYWGLRKYSGEQGLVWGDNHCEHEWLSDEMVTEIRTGKGLAEWSAKHARGGGHKAGEINEIVAVRGSCIECGAWRGAYGLEPTPEMYVEHTIQILREIKRVLRKDGVVFWNIGDSYASSWAAGRRNIMGQGSRTNRIIRMGNSTKEKDLCLIPFRVAIAAQEDGWWVRSVIIWSKNNPMPESVKDRPTESHEYILMLTKSARYYWDQEAVREEYTEPLNRWGGDTLKRETPKTAMYKDEILKVSPSSALRAGAPIRPNLEGRNIRSVWEFPTRPYPEAHFAVFPEKLPELCIKAATPEVGCCAKCGAPWERVLEKEPSKFNIRVRDAMKGRATPEEGYTATDEEIENYRQYGNHPPEGYQKTIGWQPTCKCSADKVPSLVLDPFAGGGTTLWVAKKHNRRAVGYELSQEYCDLIIDRCRQQTLDFVTAQQIDTRA